MSRSAAGGGAAEVDLRVDADGAATVQDEVRRRAVRAALVVERDVADDGGLPVQHQRQSRIGLLEEHD